MTIDIEATYEAGVLKPRDPLALAEGSRVRLSIEDVEDFHDPLEGVIGIGDGPAEGDGAENHDKYIYGDIYGKRQR